MNREMTTIVDQLLHRASTSGDTRGYTFLVNGEIEGDTLTYSQLDRRSREIAVLLQQALDPGDRALLMYGPGLDFVAAFFGCLYAGVIAVPAYPPPPAKPERCLPRLRAIATEAGIRAVLCTAETAAAFGPLFNSIPEIAGRALIVTNNHHGEDNGQRDNGHRDDGHSDGHLWKQPNVGAEDIAFLQYTSGSTAIPKGVMVSHRNILHNLAYLDHCTGNDPDTVAISWLPTYHDMGLFAGVFFPLFKGCPSYLMSPVSFLQKPSRWLQAISRYRGTISGGPNFSYDLCAERTSTEQREKLDLGSWRIAYNGAEPIRATSATRFWRAFSEQGFRWSAFRAVYGLAEATVFVTGGQLPVNFTTNDTVADSTARLVSCGSPCFGTEMVIADPDRMTSMPSGEVGEIWIRSPSVAAGYWNRAVETEYTFAAHLADTGQGPFLRTGDLGFVLDGQLYVTGRIKDLIIIRGRKYYPQDIEQTVEASHDFILPNSCAAMSLPTDDGERLVIVAEIKRRRSNGGAECATHAMRQPDAEHSDVIGSIRQAVSEQHELQTFGISLVARGSIPKTSSGKIQRHACRKALLAGTLDSVAQWTLQPFSEKPNDPPGKPGGIQKPFLPCEGDRTQHPHQDQSQSQIRDPVTL